MLSSDEFMKMFCGTGVILLEPLPEAADAAPPADGGDTDTAGVVEPVKEFGKIDKTKPRFETGRATEQQHLYEE